MQRLAEKCVWRCCELAIKSAPFFQQVAAPYIDDHSFFRENLSQQENSLMFALKLRQNACIWRELDDLICHG